MFAFVGTPIRKFWDMRGEVAHALNEHARNVSGPPTETVLMFPVLTLDAQQSRAAAAKEFRRLGLQLLPFWQNEALARLILHRVMRVRGDIAGRMLLELSDASADGNRLGPGRWQITETLRLRA